MITILIFIVEVFIFLPLNQPFPAWLLRQLAPTLLGSKSATVLSLQDTPCCNAFSAWRANGPELLQHGPLEHLVLRELPDRTIVLFYRSASLKRILRRRCNRDFFLRRGYPLTLGLDATLLHLQKRFTELSCPHEIGLLLGIPLKDVIGFMQLRCPLHDCPGPWKVYCHPEGSTRLMRRFLADENSVAAMLSKGCSPLALLKSQSRLRQDYFLKSS